jgi:hypothetical protein
MNFIYLLFLFILYFYFFYLYNILFVQFNNISILLKSKYCYLIYFLNKTILVMLLTFN